MTDGSDQLFKFSSQVQRWVIQNRLITYLHFFIIVLILFCGEFLVFLLTGFFGSSTQLLTAATNNIHSVATISLYLNSFYLLRNVQLLIIVLFLTITLYMMFINNQTFFSIILHCF